MKKQNRQILKRTSLILFLSLFALPGFASESNKAKNLQLRPNEVQSMLSLFNKTTVSGGDVEAIAGLGKKLNLGVKKAANLKNTGGTVTLPLTREEVRYCLAIIERSTFQAKYAGLILGIKTKLLAVLK